jgi:hypothetical protein
VAAVVPENHRFLQYLNPGGSVKDRVALRSTFDMILSNGIPFDCSLFPLKVIEDAEREGLLQPYTGSRIFEGTVGSTGISIATIAKARCVFSFSPYIYFIFNDNDRGYDASEKLVSWVFL